jgi:hypothetical protein
MDRLWIDETSSSVSGLCRSGRAGDREGISTDDSRSDVSEKAKPEVAGRGWGETMGALWICSRLGRGPWLTLKGLVEEFVVSMRGEVERGSGEEDFSDVAFDVYAGGDSSRTIPSTSSSESDTPATSSVADGRR